MFAREEELHSLSNEESWTVFETVVGSGAQRTLAVVGMADLIPLKTFEGSTRGQTWQTACGEILQNLGERKIKGLTNEGQPIETVLGGGLRGVFDKWSKDVHWKWKQHEHDADVVLFEVRSERR